MANKLSDMQVSEIREIFALFDKKSEGAIDTTELGTIIRALNLNPTEAEIIELMKKIDPAGKGKFDLPALIQLIADRGKDPDTLDDLIEALKVFDSDRDGKITVQEFKIAMMNMGEKMGEHELEEVVNDSELVRDNFIHI